MQPDVDMIEEMTECIAIFVEFYHLTENTKDSGQTRANAGILCIRKYASKESHQAKMRFNDVSFLVSSWELLVVLFVLFSWKPS
jgi:hypothetical protein